MINIQHEWEYKKLKHIFSCNDDVLSENTAPEQIIDYIDIGSVSATEGIQEVTSYAFSEAPSRARRLVKDGDIIISTVRTYLEAIAAVDKSYDHCVVSTGFAVLRPVEINSGYAKYVLRNRQFIDKVITESVGISYPAINSTTLMNLSIPVPSMELQRLISLYLDRETYRIDSLIAEKQNFVSLLKEKRQALITHVVTKGLEPNVPMKDSGVEWLGKVPEHWDIRYSKWLFSERNIRATETDEQLTASQKYGVIPQKLFMELENQKVVQVILNPEILKKVEKDDFVISMRSFQGGLEHSNYSGCISSAYVPIYPRIEIDTMYFKFLFKSKSYIQALQSTSDLIRDGQALRYKNFIEVDLPLPPVDEQKRISTFISLQTDRIDNLVAETNKSIELLKEKRSSLITAAVTGEIDVRNYLADIQDNKEAV